VRDRRYLNNIVEQDHRAIKRRCASMLGFKSFKTAEITLAGIELAHRIRKRQFSVRRGRRDSRYWRYNYRFNGKQKTLAPGVYPYVSLETARARHQAARHLLAAGTDPSLMRWELRTSAVAEIGAYRGPHMPSDLMIGREDSYLRKRG
jgi:hypothetical protein